MEIQYFSDIFSTVRWEYFLSNITHNINGIEYWQYGVIKREGRIA
jgi:hypothetical protein